MGETEGRRTGLRERGEERRKGRPETERERESNGWRKKGRLRQKGMEGYGE